MSPSEEEPDSSWLEKASEESREDCRKRNQQLELYIMPTRFNHNVQSTWSDAPLMDVEAEEEEGEKESGEKPESEK